MAAIGEGLDVLDLKTQGGEEGMPFRKCWGDVSVAAIDEALVVMDLKTQGGAEGMSFRKCCGHHRKGRP